MPRKRQASAARMPATASVVKAKTNPIPGARVGDNVDLMRIIADIASNGGTDVPVMRRLYLAGVIDTPIWHYAGNTLEQLQKEREFASEATLYLRQILQQYNYVGLRSDLSDDLKLNAVFALNGDVSSEPSDMVAGIHPLKGRLLAKTAADGTLLTFKLPPAPLLQPTEKGPGRAETRRNRASNDAYGWSFYAV